MSIKVMVIDDHALYRDSLASFLDLSGFLVTGTYPNNADTLHLLHSIDLPDIVIITLKSSRPETLQNICRLRQDFPCIKVLVMSLYDEKIPRTALQQVGIKDVFIKSIHQPGRLLEILHTIQNSMFFTSKLIDYAH